jgi:hypothetical protein
MCWNLEVSVISALYGWLVCVFLRYRNGVRDKFYSNYLFTFTFTQLIDIALWYLNKNNTNGLQDCSEYQLQFINYPKNEQLSNYIISKYILPITIFLQHTIQCTYPNTDLLYRKKYILILLHLIPIFFMSLCFSCTILYPSYFPIDSETLIWGGNISGFSFIVNQIFALLHSGIVTIVFYIVMKNDKRVLLAHIIPLYMIILFLFITEGNLMLGSKWCWYCLIYSIIYIADPIWYKKKIK